MIDWRQVAQKNNLSIQEFKKEIVHAVIAIAEQEAEECGQHPMLPMVYELKNHILTIQKKTEGEK